MAIKNNDTEMMIFGTTVLGANLAFLIFNMYPAKMFLGDTDCLELIRLFCGGETKKNLAHKFNINLSTVYDILKRYNIDYYRRYNGSKSVQLLQSNQE